MIILRDILIFIAGFLVAITTLFSAIRTVVVPRAERVRMTGWVFQPLRFLFNLVLKKVDTYEELDRIMAFYGPTGLLLLPVQWVTFVSIGYTAMFWSLGIRPLKTAFKVSGSSLLTLGFSPVETLPQIILSFTEATLGLGLIALMLAYLPSIYAAFSRRETAVAMLEVRAGAPPSAVTMLTRSARLKGLDKLSDVWSDWEAWFADLEESHTSIPAIVFFRSPQPDRSWVTAAGTVIDTAALVASTVDVPLDINAQICIRSGFVALRKIADFFEIEHNHNPVQGDPISITRYEFDQVCAELEEGGVPLRDDRDQAWKDFAGWRVNYDTVLLELAALTMAPYAMWSSDRSPVHKPERKENTKSVRESGTFLYIDRSEFEQSE